MPDPSLIADLEAAQDGSRELSDRVLLALGITREGDMLVAEGKTLMNALIYTDDETRAWIDTRPDPTRSLDDAVALVPGGWRIYSIQEQKCPTLFFAGIDRWGRNETAQGRSNSFALALCIAILKAKEQDE